MKQFNAVTTPFGSSDDTTPQETRPAARSCPAAGTCFGGRRNFLGSMAHGIGGIALASLLNPELQADGLGTVESVPAGLTHLAPKAKRIIYLFQSGGPAQMDLLDPKPQLKDYHGQELPASIRQGQRLTGMTSGQTTFPVASSIFPFHPSGSCGTEFSDVLPYTSEIADDICVIRSMHTDAINHDPAITFFQTGFQIAGRPSIGSWLSYGLGSENDNLPSFVAMVSSGSGTGGQPLYDRLWGSGFLPSRHQGVRFRAGSDPILFLSNPDGIDRTIRRQTLDDIGTLNAIRQNSDPDPEIAARTSQYEMAFRMQTSVPELTDLSSESDHTFELYGADAKKPGTFAANCLLARRLSERGVRFVQLFHRGWDHHGNLPGSMRRLCGQTDQPAAALVSDLKARGLLDETLVIWGGEFGRTVYCQDELTAKNYGRDHHPRCLSIWMAGGGIKGGMTWGATDDFSYNVAENPVSVHDLHATILHLMGIDHKRLTYKFQGRYYRLTDVHGEVVEPLLA